MRRLRGAVGVVVGVAGLVTGCSSVSASDAGRICGTAHSAAGVPVVIKVAKGSVGCKDALAVESQYAAMIRGGHVAGNGGGAPVTVSGWICQGFPTPEVLRTGDASQCRHGDTEILAVLPSPTASPASSPKASATAG